MKKYRFRTITYLIVLIGIFGILSLSCYNYLEKSYQNKKLKAELENRYTKLISNEEDLENEVIKLQDPEYAAKYARERYLYSKDGELIIKLPSED